MQTIRWGLYGPGRIAAKFADAVHKVSCAELVAVAGRTPDNATAFARKHQVPRVWENLDQLVHDPDVDAIYIATTHNAHYKAACACLEAGKAVLCEKPLVMNARQAESLVDISRANRVFLMEAMWTRFLPVWRRVRVLLSEGVIGEVRMVTAELGFSAPPDPAGRLLNKALAGGALLDVGVYPLSMAQMVLSGAPECIQAQGVIGVTGVDENMAITARFPGQRLALIGISLTCRMDSRFVIAGSRGHIVVPRPFHCATDLVWVTEGEDVHQEHCPHDGNGFEGQIEEVARCLDQHELESPVMSQQDSLIVARFMDEARRQIGLRYAADDDIHAGA